MLFKVFCFYFLLLISLFNSTPSPTSYPCSSGSLKLTSTSISYGTKLNNVYYAYKVTGKLEVYYSSEWGTVCDDLFTNTSATVACKQLGYSTGIYAYSSSSGSSSSQCIWLDNVVCTGSESQLVYCSNNGYGNENCDHFEDVFVSCYTNNSINYATCGAYTSSYSGSCSPTPSPYSYSSSSSSSSNYSWLAGVIVPIIFIIWCIYVQARCRQRARFSRPPPQPAPSALIVKSQTVTQSQPTTMPGQIPMSNYPLNTMQYPNNTFVQPYGQPNYIPQGYNPYNNTTSPPPVFSNGNIGQPPSQYPQPTPQYPQPISQYPQSTPQYSQPYQPYIPQQQQPSFHGYQPQIINQQPQTQSSPGLESPPQSQPSQFQGYQPQIPIQSQPSQFQGYQPQPQPQLQSQLQPQSQSQSPQPSVLPYQQLYQPSVPQVKDDLPTYDDAVEGQSENKDVTMA